MQHPPNDRSTLRRTDRYVDAYGRQLDLFWTTDMPPRLTDVTGTRLITVMHGANQAPHPLTFDITGVSTIEEAYAKFDELFEAEFERLQSESRKANLASGVNSLTP
jgi:hypothetical protein